MRVYARSFVTELIDPMSLLTLEEIFINQDVDVIITIKSYKRDSASIVRIT